MLRILRSMKDKNFEVWKEIYETTYVEALIYDCNDIPTTA